MSNKKREIVIRKGIHIEVWSTLSKVCEAYPEFKYNTIRGLKFPFEYKGWTFYRITVNEKRDPPPEKDPEFLRRWKTR